MSFKALWKEVYFGAWKPFWILELSLTALFHAENLVPFLFLKDLLMLFLSSVYLPILLTVVALNGTFTRCDWPGPGLKFSPLHLKLWFMTAKLHPLQCKLDKIRIRVLTWISALLESIKSLSTLLLWELSVGCNLCLRNWRCSRVNSSWNGSDRVAQVTQDSCNMSRDQVVAFCNLW